MNRYIFRLATVFTFAAAIIFATSPEPSKLIVVVFPLLIFFPVTLNKRRKSINMSLADALIAFVPYFGSRQLKQLYFA